MSRLSPSVRGLARALARHAPQPDWSPARHREVFDRAAAGRPAAPDVSTAPIRVAGLDAESHVPNQPRSEQTLVHLHGGGFIMGSLTTTRPLATHIAAATGRRVLVLDYPLAPEATYQDQHGAVSASVRELLQDHAGDLVLIGDSAGGALALGTERALHREGAGHGVAALALLSPWLDLRLRAESIDQNAATDPQLPRWLLHQMLEACSGASSGTDSADPAVSAVLGPLDGLPPTLVQGSPQEALADDARLLAARAAQAGSHVELQWWDGMIHVWHQFAPRLQEANDALAAVGTFLDETFS